jgi:hypothetical protein
MYAMQRANGDWFAVKDQGRLRVPVFVSSSEAMQARAYNSGMMLFKPVILDERALRDLEQTETDETSCFWLVSNPSVSLSRGRPIEHAQLVLLVRDSGAIAARVGEVRDEEILSQL